MRFCQTIIGIFERMLPHFSYDFLAYKKKKEKRKRTRLTRVVSCLARDKNELIDSKLPAF